MSLRFLEFPGLVREQVLQTLFEHDDGVFDIETLAGLSKRAHHVVRSARHPLTGFNVNINRLATKLEYKVDDELKAMNYFKYAGAVRLDGMFFGSDPYWFISFETKINFCSNCKIIKNAAENVISVFNRPVLDVQIDCDGIPPTRVPHLLPFTQCQQMTVDGSEPMTNHKLKMLLEKANPSKWLSVQLPIRDDFTMDLGKIPADTLEFIGNSHWITLENLKRARCTKSKFTKCELSVKDLEGIVENWMENLDDTTFTLMVINLKRIPTEKMNLERFNAREWDEERRGRVFVQNPIEGVILSDGLDIERSDGLLATVLFRKNLFIFAVWHERFPNLEGIRVETPSRERGEGEEDSDGEGDEDEN